MRTPSYIAVTLCALSSSVLSAPTPTAQLDLLNTVGSITSPGAGNDNIFKDNGNSNGQNNGNGNSAGNNNGNDNVAGNENSAGNGNTFNLPQLTGLLGKEKRTPDVVKDLLSPVTGTLTNTVGSITSPVAGSGNSFLGNGNNNGQGNGNDNTAGTNNGNGNAAGNGNSAGNDNEFNVSPDTSLPNIELPDINVSPTINFRGESTSQ